MRCFSCMPQRPRAHSRHLLTSTGHGKWQNGIVGVIFFWSTVIVADTVICSFGCVSWCEICSVYPQKKENEPSPEIKGSITESILHSRLLRCRAHSVLSRSLPDTDSGLIKALFKDAALLPAHLKGGVFKIQGWPFCCSHWMPSEWRTSSLQRPL